MRAASVTSRSRSSAPSKVDRTRAIATASALASTPMAARPAAIASTSTVPLPQKGSTTVSPGFESASIAPRAIEGCMRPA